MSYPIKSEATVAMGESPVATEIPWTVVTRRKRGATKKGPVCQTYTCITSVLKDLNVGLAKNRWFGKSGGVCGFKLDGSENDMLYNLWSNGYEYDVWEMGTPLHEACRQGNLAAVKFILGKLPRMLEYASRDYLSDGSNSGMTPLDHACDIGDIDIAKYLVAAGHPLVLDRKVDANVDHRYMTTYVGAECVYHAIDKGHAHICEWFANLSKGAFDATVSLAGYAEERVARPLPVDGNILDVLVDKKMALQVTSVIRLLQIKQALFISEKSLLSAAKFAKTVLGSDTLTDKQRDRLRITYTQVANKLVDAVAFHYPTLVEDDT